ncbi:putative ATPase [Asanoa ferruginea]|uniref:Putative ATPase n=1 Tax=Asanoa ferruginea TaxID=53367 RepID=A0A3D9ZQK9_9ACTN|nr:DUF4062 domain-containing protein [Asanoa ferruginea]REF99525.1 putative ATPase [Asanoa ferruginea]
MIRTPDHRLRVFVSSTLVELAAERGAARSAIEQLLLAPVMFESGARPHPAQAVYRSYLARSDVFVGIYADSYGWVGPGMTVSGLEDEFERAASLPRLLYVTSPAPDRDPALRRMLERIKADGQSSYKYFSGAAELRALILTDLATLLAERFDEPRRERAAVPTEPATALVGREAELARIVGELESDHRLVVLTGTGGIGKTRLALAAMERTAGRWPDGVAFVDLSSTTDGRLVPDAIASALGVVGQGNERPVDALRRALSGRRMLLVLDNLEQVLDAAPVVADLVRQAPRLQILATSRVALRLRGEREIRVDALEVPPALRLLVDRIRDVQGGFELTDQNTPALAELCRRLGGLPLALELAAAWLRLLTPDQLLADLDARLDQPGALADLPDRQQTLTRTISWSYDLLPPAARELLARLSVFVAPFTVDDAVAVCGTESVDVVQELSRLLDASMVGPGERPDGQRGFQLLDPIRRFAAARLDDPQAVLGRLHRHVLAVLAAADTRLGSQELVLRRLDSEQPNLQAVLDWVGQAGQPSGPLLRALGDVWVWLLARGHLRQPSELWRRIQALPESLLRTDSDRLALHWLAASRLLNDGAFDEAGALLDEVLPTARRIEPPVRLALLVSARAIVAPSGPHGGARATFEEALAVARAADDPLVSGYVLSHYGLLLSVEGEADRARDHHDEALAIADALNDENLRAEAHYDLAVDAMLLGDRAAARSHLAKAVAGYRGIDHLDGLTRCLAQLGALALDSGDSHLAARLVGATAAARETIGLAPWPSAADLERRTTERLGALLAADLDAGRGLTIDDALAAAQHLGGA